MSAPRPTTADGRSRVLAGGVEMPLLGLGVWLTDAGREAEQAVSWALEAGYRHVDTAQAYGNEESVGAALRASGVPRDELFVTTKFLPASTDPERELEASLERLGLDRVDLYLVHWPQGGPTWAWPGMERCLERGLTRAVGVSNFDVEELDAVLGVASSPPTVDQVAFNAFAFRRGLLDACEERGIALEAYSPLTHGRDLEDPRIADVAARVGRTPAQVLLRWCLERDLVVIPKSVRRERIVENAQVFDFVLSPEDLAELDGLDRTGGTSAALERRWW
jgi:2,5-diketo-D-gluconate reductase A